MDKLHKLTNTLKAADHRVTKPRQRVFEVLAENDALSMAQLVKLVGDGIDRTSVYRTIDLFEKLGVVHRIQIGWKYKLELSEHYSHHHHHIICVHCGKSEVFKESQQIEGDIHTLADGLGYELQAHMLELRGVCQSCQASS